MDIKAMDKEDILFSKNNGSLSPLRKSVSFDSSLFERLKQKNTPMGKAEIDFKLPLNMTPISSDSGQMFQKRKGGRFERQKGLDFDVLPDSAPISLMVEKERAHQEVPDPLCLKAKQKQFVEEQKAIQNENDKLSLEDGFALFFDSNGGLRTKKSCDLDVVEKAVKCVSPDAYLVRGIWYLLEEKYETAFRCFVVSASGNSGVGVGDEIGGTSSPLAFYNFYKIVTEAFGYPKETISDLKLRKDYEAYFKEDFIIDIQNGFKMYASSSNAKTSILELQRVNLWNAVKEKYELRKQEKSENLKKEMPVLDVEALTSTKIKKSPSFLLKIFGGILGSKESKQTKSSSKGRKSSVNKRDDLYVQALVTPRRPHKNDEKTKFM
jgi:hypothetical protein